MKFARSLRILLAVALLAAWQNALVHPLEHFDEHGGLVHLADGERGDPGSTPESSCDAIAAVAICIAGSPGLDFAVPSGIEFSPVRQADKVLLAPLLAYRSQAPPQHS